MATDYGIKFQKETVTPGTYADVAEVISVKLPKIESGTVETTSHGSGGKRKHKSNGLVGTSAFSIKVNYLSGDTLAAEVGQEGNYRIVIPEEQLQWTFSATCIGFDPSEADAQNPSALTAEVTFQPNECVIEDVP